MFSRSLAHFLIHGVKTDIDGDRVRTDADGDGGGGGADVGVGADVQLYGGEEVDQAGGDVGGDEDDVLPDCQPLLPKRGLMKLSKMATIADSGYIPKHGSQGGPTEMAAVVGSGYISIPQMAAPVPECAGEEDDYNLRVSQEWTLN